MSNGLLNKIKRKLMKLRLQPIRVFCFHQVSDEFDASTMWECAWTQKEDFMREIQELKKEYTFISLPEARYKLEHDIFRKKKYAVLTADDGWDSLNEIIPWIAEQRIPTTLFINPAYMDGIHKQERKTERLLTKSNIEELVAKYKPLITIGSHGWIHTDYTQKSNDEFLNLVNKAHMELSKMDMYIPYFAFPFGKRTTSEIRILKMIDITPVLIDGSTNIKYDGNIHRESLEEHE